MSYFYHIGMKRVHTFSDTSPQLLFVVKLLEGIRESDMSSAYVPEQNSKGIHVYTAIIMA